MATDAGEQNELDLEAPEFKQRLFRLGMRPSKSAEAAREREIAAVRAMSPEERMMLALRLGRRDRAIGEARVSDAATRH